MAKLSKYRHAFYARNRSKGKTMIDLSPETAGASQLAIRIAQRVLELDMMRPITETAKGDATFDLSANCAAMARMIDVELTPLAAMDAEYAAKYPGAVTIVH